MRAHARAASHPACPAPITTTSYALVHCYHCIGYEGSDHWRRGREHALAWRLAQSPEVDRVFATPGNPGIARIAACLSAGDGSPAAYLAVAESVDADLTVVGPEAPLVAGVVDAFRARGRAIFGPTAAAARLEGSKSHLQRTFCSKAKSPLRAFVAAASPAEAHPRPRPLHLSGRHQSRRSRRRQRRRRRRKIALEAESASPSLKPPFVIEEFLTGEEVSFIVLSDGRNVVPLRAHPGPQSRLRWRHRSQHRWHGRLLRFPHPHRRRKPVDILRSRHPPTVEATGFTGFLYAGLMMTAAGPKVLEFNVRLGDPETQPIMHRMRTRLRSPAAGRRRRPTARDSHRMESRTRPSVWCSPPAATPAPFPRAGQFTASRTPKPPAPPSFTPERAGIRLGWKPRAAASSASPLPARTLAAAIDNAYAAARVIHFEGMHYRPTLAAKASKRVQ